MPITKCSQRFREFVEEGGTEVIRLPPQSPNLNAFDERFVRYIKEECLGRMLLVGQVPLRRAITEYMTHSHEERKHQGLENQRIRPMPVIGGNDGEIQRRARLGGMLNYYHRVAA